MLQNEDSEIRAGQYEELFKDDLRYDDVQFFKDLSKEGVLEKLEELKMLACKFEGLKQKEKSILYITVVWVGFRLMWNTHAYLKDNFYINDRIFPQLFGLTCSGQPIAICEHLYDIASYKNTHVVVLPEWKMQCFQ